MNEIMKFETADIVMLQDQVLVKPYKFRYKSVEQTKLDDEANKGKDPKKDIMHLKTVKEKVLDGNIQTVEIVSIAKDNRLGLEIGDVVAVDWRKAKEFDLIKGTSTLFLYDIVCKVILPT